jgi:hypothetical protein
MWEFPVNTGHGLVKMVLLFFCDRFAFPTCILCPYFNHGNPFNQTILYAVEDAGPTRIKAKFNSKCLSFNR